MNAFHGPIVCTATPEFWARLLTGPLGMRRVGRDDIDTATTDALFGVRDARARHDVYETPGTNTGVRVVTLTPAAGKPMRRPDRGTDLDALKVIDFYAPDFDAAMAALREAGFNADAHVAHYALPQGEIREAHLWTPDGVVCATLGGPDSLFGPLVGVKRGVVSEVMGISAPVSDAQAAHDFYTDGLGLGVVAEYEFESDSFAALLGRDEPVHIAARNYGDAPSRPFLGIVDYGELRAQSRSLAGAAGFDRRGLIGVTVLCDDVDAAFTRLSRDFGGQARCQLHTTDLTPWGRVRCAGVLAAHGVWHALIQPA